MNKGNSVSGIGIVLVDLQESLLSGIAKKTELLDSVRLLIKSIKLFNLPHLITEQVPDKLGPTESSLKLLLSDCNPISKKSFSIFGSELVRLQIEKLNLSHLILAGVESPICIYLSALEALKQGYEITILSDCVGARRTEDEEVALDKLKGSGCHIIPLESFLYGFMGSPEHGNFREVSKLVRNRSIYKTD